MLERNIPDNISDAEIDAQFGGDEGQELQEQEQEEETLSECCGAEIIIGFCSDCKEHAE